MTVASGPMPENSGLASQIKIDQKLEIPRRRNLTGQLQRLFGNFLQQRIAAAVNRCYAALHRRHGLDAGFRGRPPADRKALEATALALGRFYLDHRAKIEEIEINPLIVRPQGAVAVDIRVAWRKEN